MYNTCSDIHSLTLQNNYIFPVVWDLRQCRWTSFLFYSSWFPNCSPLMPPSSRPWNTSSRWVVCIQTILDEQLLRRVYSPTLKSRNHAKIFGQLHISYFPNKCGGLAKISAKQPKFNRSETHNLVKSLTFYDRSLCDRLNNSADMYHGC
jgi:hypothetical protein